jgi:hypothetical protein
MIAAIAASDDKSVHIIYIMISTIQTTHPTSNQLISAGIALPGNTTSYSIQNLAVNSAYYGWALAIDKDGIESSVVPSAPAAFTTSEQLPTPIITSTSTYFIYHRPVFYIRTGGGATTWVTQAIPLARNLIGTSKRH